MLRLEKGHAIVGQDTDALSMPADAGMGWLIKADKDDFIGRAATSTIAGGGQVLPGSRCWVTTSRPRARRSCSTAPPSGG